jgi:hypothetical protein
MGGVMGASSLRFFIGPPDSYWPVNAEGELGGLEDAVFAGEGGPDWSRNAGDDDFLQRCYSINTVVSLQFNKDSFCENNEAF